MKKYFLIHGDVEPEIVGVDNGVTQAEIKKNCSGSLKNLDLLMENLGTRKFWDIEEAKRRNLIQNLEVALECVELLPKAKLTDFLMFSPALKGCRYMVSEKVASILLRHNLPFHKFFPAIVKSKTTSHKYFLPYFEWYKYEVLDYSRSVFYTGNHISGKKPRQFVSSQKREDYEKSNRQFTHILDAYLNTSFDASLDWFEILATIVVSERLKDELEKAGCISGIYFSPAFGEKIHPIHGMRIFSA
jgi:hypothetical protein